MCQTCWSMRWRFVGAAEGNGGVLATVVKPWLTLRASALAAMGGCGLMGQLGRVGGLCLL